MDNRKGYKAFKKGMICAPDENHVKQYEENTTYEEKGGKICGAGMMHYCVRPLDVLRHYQPVDNNGMDFTEFAEVEAFDKPVTDDNQKFATKKLHIGAKISFAHLVEASVKYDLEKCNIEGIKTGNCSGNSQTGYCSKSKQTGKYSVSVSTGAKCEHDAAGKKCIAVCWGADSMAKGAVGSYLVLSEWENDEMIDAKMTVIDGEHIKANTWYKLENGEFVEVQE